MEAAALAVAATAKARPGVAVTEAAEMGLVAGAEAVVLLEHRLELMVGRTAAADWMGVEAGAMVEEAMAKAEMVAAVVGVAVKEVEVMAEARRVEAAVTLEQLQAPVEGTMEAAQTVAADLETEPTAAEAV